MKKIYVSNIQINMTNYEGFGQELQNAIDRMQSKGFEVEVQYCPCSLGNSRICVNALVLGYIMEDNE